MDTIFALASARGRAGVAVVRLSGPLSHTAVRALAGDIPPLRQAALRKLCSGGEVLDEALVLTFAKGKSFTGEESAELHLHGGAAVVAAVLGSLGAMDGLRLAEPGEYTRRALENGRLNLAQVEGLADLIDADTQAQRRQAQRVLSGAIGRRVEGWRALLLRALALLEATIDFVDEDLPVDVMPEVHEIVDGLLRDLHSELAGYGAAERVRDGFEVAIVGRPNAGKSTLLNRIAGREVALATPIAGTTRDVLEVRLDLGGLAVTLLDTAGLRVAKDDVEALGIDRAVARANAADLRIFLLDEEGPVRDVLKQPDDIVVRGKADLFFGPGDGVSGVSGLGVAALLDRVAKVLAGRAASAGVLTQLRHRLAVEGAISTLESARSALDQDASPEIVAEDMRACVHSLESLLGRIDVEAVLGEIFARFCIGK